MNHYKLIILFVFTILSCSKKEDVQNKRIEFKRPIVTNSKLLKQDSIQKHNYEVEHIIQYDPIFIGKFKFQDSIDIQNTNTNIYENRLDDYEEVGLNGLELITDYKTTVFYNFNSQSTHYFSFYPVYIVNSTTKNKVLFGKDSHIFGIQEAQDKELYNSWKPIEAKGWDFCGNGHWNLIICPGEFGLALMPKYKGDYNTKLRTRIKNGDNIIVSNSYKGVINKSQFKVKDSSHVQRRLKESNGSDSFSIFYGAALEKEDWIVLSSQK